MLNKYASGLAQQADPVKSDSLIQQMYVLSVNALPCAGCCAMSKVMKHEILCYVVNL